ncbi:MAG: hypothetical protein LLG04_10130 [Parachlamydia sp.]|nr:hypothetical protein [Parachlamydia sp.]
MMNETWNYFVLPGGVARLDEQHVQYRDPKTGNWVEVAEAVKRIEFKRTISQDGVSVSEDDANRNYKSFMQERKG